MDFRNLALKESADELRRGSGEDQAWSRNVDVHFNEQRIDAVARHVLLIGHLVFRGKNAFRFLQIHNDGTGIETADRAVDDLTDFVFKFVFDDCFFRFADLLQDRLFGCLGGDAPEIFRCYFPTDFFADFRMRNALPRIGKKNLVVVRILGYDFEKRPCTDVSGIPVDFHLKLIGRMYAFPGCRKQSLFHRIDQLLFAYAPFLLDILKNGQKFMIHLSFLHPADY